MSVISIWVLDVDDVDPTIDTVWNLKHRGLVDVFDAAYVRWPVGAAKPSTGQLAELATEHALDSSFWGMLFGLTFFSADLGPGAASTASRVAEQVQALGIGSDVTDQMREKIRPGKGAVITYSSGRFAATGENRAEIDRVLKGIQADLIRTNVTGADEAMILETFGRGPRAVAPSKDISTIDLVSTYLHLDGASAPAVPGGSVFWDQLISGGGTERHEAIRGGGWLVAAVDYAATWPTWEMHPNGDEVVSCLAGVIDMRLELEAGDEVVRLTTGQTVVVPAGVWHTATVIEPGQCLHITAGRGTEVRPA